MLPISKPGTQGHMMKNWIVPGLAALALTAALQTASAADLPARMPVKAAPYAAPGYNWYGFYVGGHVGYGWGNDAVSFSNTTGGYAGLIGTSIPFSAADQPKGVLGGIQWGSNWQFGQWVLGIDSDFAWTDIHSSETVTIGGGIARANFVDQKLDWLSTTRARAGFLLQPNLMIFGSGGIAAGRANVSVANNLVGVACTVGNACPNDNARDTLWGWAAGAGIEYATGPWLWRLEYLHYDLGDLTFTYSDRITASTVTASTNFSGDIVRGAISYKFDWQPLDLITGRR